MDELELLKRDWQKQENVLPRLSYKEIYQMILKKSSSIVRWIFIISIIEFLLWSSLDIIFRVSNMYDEVQKVDMGVFPLITSIIYYGVLAYFIIRFYLNYRKIKTTDSTKILMENIINTRKTVRQYIWVNISLFVFIAMASMGYMILFTNELHTSATGQQPPVWLIIVSTLFVTIVFAGLIALFYRLIYGILTRRLKKNYKELEKLEV